MYKSSSTASLNVSFPSMAKEEMPCHRELNISPKSTQPDGSFRMYNIHSQPFPFKSGSGVPCESNIKIKYSPKLLALSSGWRVVRHR